MKRLWQQCSYQIGDIEIGMVELMESIRQSLHKGAEAASVDVGK